MTGHNHYPDCVCGWCAGGWNNHGSVVRPINQRASPPVWPGLQATLASFTVPNACCPACNASVFFYTSPFGGRVFFDELGPPWPKHPCTDNPAVSRSLFRNRPQTHVAVITPAWKRNGWAPIRIERVERGCEWARITARRLDKKLSFVRLTPVRVELTAGMPAHVKPLNLQGLGRIAWFAHRSYGIERLEDILVHRTLNACRVAVVKAALSGHVPSAVAVGRAAAFGWGKAQNGTGPVTYPDFVNWDIARTWLKHAAECGSKEAQALLTDAVWTLLV